MKNNSTSRVTEALAILKESAEELTLEKKAKRGGARKASQIKEVKKKPRKWIRESATGYLANDAGV